MKSKSPRLIPDSDATASFPSRYGVGSTIRTWAFPSQSGSMAASIGLRLSLTNLMRDVLPNAMPVRTIMRSTPERRHEARDRA